MRSQILTLCLVTGLGIFFSDSLLAQLPTDFYDELWDNDYDRLTGIAFDEEGRGFTWERNGLVFRLSPDGERLPTPLLDIREEVADWSDMGMVGFALHPDFLENGWFYVFYSLDRHYYEFFGTSGYSPIATITDEATIARLTRYTADTNTDFTTVVANSRKVLLGTDYADGAPLVFKTHATGSLVFGTDGTLFAAVGETAFPDDNDFGSNNNTYYQQAIADGIIREEENVGAFRSQMVNSLGGKILRLDAETGAGLSSNPFYDAAAPRSPASRVWALGFRNPYRFVLVPETGSHFPADGQPGHLLVGDVGGNEWEEITLITEGGQNAGWPFFEGLEIRTAAVNSGILEQDEIIGSCQGGVPFSDLLAEDGASVGLTNQCNTNPAFSHRRPLIAYRNKAEGRLPDSEIPIFDANGQADRQSLSDPNSPVDSEIFHGIGSLAGVFYNGEQFPQEYQGRYLHIDYLGWMQWMDWDEDGQLTKVEPFLETDRNLVSVAVHPLDGSIWYVDVLNQQLRRIGYGGIPRPVPEIEASSWYGPSPLSVDLSAASSSTATEYPLTYLWELPNGQTSTEESISTTIVAPSEAPFIWSVKLTVTDSSGQ
ncbi:MAG: PQQ-dependent sugar dehydrogenase, partial [Bacteroidota bacterium]